MELIVSWLDGEETIQCQLQPITSRNSNNVILKEIRMHLTDLTTKYLII